MTFRFVLQNKNSLLLTVLEIERTIYIGSGRELPLSEFIAVNPPLEFRFPEAALRH